MSQRSVEKFSIIAITEPLWSGPFKPENVETNLLWVKFLNISQMVGPNYQDTIDETENADQDLWVGLFADQHVDLTDLMVTQDNMVRFKFKPEAIIADYTFDTLDPPATWFISSPLKYSVFSTIYPIRRVKQNGESVLEMKVPRNNVIFPTESNQLAMIPNQLSKIPNGINNGRCPQITVVHHHFHHYNGKNMRPNNKKNNNNFAWDW